MRHFAVPVVLVMTALGTLTAAAPPTAANEAVFRCTHGMTVSYQWTTCEPGQQETAVRVAAAPAPTAAPAAAPAVPAASPAPAQQGAASSTQTPPTPRAAPQTVRVSWRAQVRSPAPYIGISDDAVLNMRGWGRPAKIVRTRSERAWVEHWTYLSPGGETRHLQFENGKLVAANVEPAPYAVQVANAPEPGQQSQ